MKSKYMQHGYHLFHNYKNLAYRYTIASILIFRIKHNTAQRLILCPVNTTPSNNPARHALHQPPPAPAGPHLRLAVLHFLTRSRRAQVHGLSLLELAREVKELRREVNVAPARANRLRLDVGELAPHL